MVHLQPYILLISYGRLLTYHTYMKDYFTYKNVGLGRIIVSCIK